jgi:3-methyladenine DNA glycosylase AlkD
MPRPRTTAAVRAAAARIDQLLAEQADPERAPKERAYLKSDLAHLGVPVAGVRRAVGTALREDERLAGHDATVALAELLWRPRRHERRLAAVELLVARVADLGTDDLPLLERLLRESRTWAFVDPLAGTVVGALVLRDRSDHGDDVLAQTLERWSVDEDFWLRRSALLSQLPLLTQATTSADDFATFARWADAMLDEKEFFIRKAIGWVLRETSKRRPELVVAYLAPRVDRLSGVTWREAVRRLPPGAVEALPPRTPRA